MNNAAQWKSLEGQIISCRLCPRLVEWREKVAKERRRAYREWDYWGKPVPGFGDYRAAVFVVGLAPGAHGSNRTGRMFTGDASGLFLYRALYRAGFASQPESICRDDDLVLRNLYISAICRCVPPANKPHASEIDNCTPFLRREIQLLKNLRVIVVLGRIAFEAINDLFELKMNPTFQHGAEYKPSENLPRIVVSYHPSQQNTQTGRLTEDMFDKIWGLVQNKI
jgi:uracil-DNA glycosylase family 4